MLDLLRPLVEERRIVAIHLPSCEQDPVRLIPADFWQQYYDAFATPGGERPELLLPDVDENAFNFEPAKVTATIPAVFRKSIPQFEARAAITERFLKCRGPVTVYELMGATGWPFGAVEHLLAAVVETGTVAQGVYTSAKSTPQWVNKANLEEIHRLTMGYLKRELAACSPAEVVDFLTRWQHIHPATRLQGLDGLREAIRQLQGVEMVQGIVESEVLPGRVADYRPEMLDRLIAAGEVVWRRVSTQHIRRGRLTLCLRKDSGWLGSGSPLKFNSEKEADCDIAEEILKVRHFFREQGPAYFDDVLETTGVVEDAALRAVWHLAWCGELTCDTFECLRHAGFEATLSACYDLMNTPGKILRGRDTMARVVERMKRRKLDPRLGRWTPTERLCPPRQPLPESDILRQWCDQLLRRWGIVSRDVLAAEEAAPAWPALLPELKRRELLGQVRRGYFIADHQGEQYGLPEAVELLRECRARREGQRGWLPDEPLFVLSYHDPANLYITCLEMQNEDGGRIERTNKLAFDTARMVIQAGQPILLAHGQLAVTLTPVQLIACFDLLRRNNAGGKMPLHFRAWNGHPLELHPVRALLGAEGDLPLPEYFLPYYLDNNPAEGLQAWQKGRITEPLRPAVERMREVVIPELERRGWSVAIYSYVPWASYGEIGRFSIWVSRSFVQISVNTRRIVQEEDKKYRMYAWDRAYQLRFTASEEINDTFLANLRRLLELAEEYEAMYQRKRGKA